MAAKSVKFEYHWLSATLCVQFSENAELKRPLSLTSTSGWRLFDELRPPLPRKKLAHSVGTTAWRSSPLIPNHGAKYGSWRNAGPPRALRSSYVASSCPIVPPACNVQLFRSVMCTFELYAASSGSPLVVQYSHQLLFHWSRL